MHVLLALSQGSVSAVKLSFEQNILDAELGIENYRFPSGLTSGEVFQQLSKVDYFYGTALQGQELC